MTHHQTPQQPLGPDWLPPGSPSPRPPKRRRLGRVVLGGLGALALLGVGVGIGSSGSDEPSVSTPTVWVTPQPLDTATAPTPDAVAAEPTAAAEQAGPRTSFSAGTYEVGSDIEPGKYKTTGPDSGPSCYWARLKDTDGDFDSIIANGNAEGQTTVTISKTDGAFQTGDCTWTKSA